MVVVVSGQLNRPPGVTRITQTKHARGNVSLGTVFEEIESHR